MTKIAADFGTSSVTFTKCCERLGVPPPPRGYWQQVAWGQTPDRERLPQPDPQAPTEVVITRFEKRAKGLRRASPDIPRIEVPDRVRKLHPVAVELDGLLQRDCHHQYMLTVRGYSQVVLKVGEASRKRAMRLLHTLFAAVEADGHQVRLIERSDTRGTERGRRALAIIVDRETMELSLHEHLTRTVHVKTADEQKWGFFRRRYDLVPSGEFVLEMSVPWGGTPRIRWRDSEKGRLEGLLGEVVWSVNEAARSLVVHRAKLAEEALRAEVARQLAEGKERERQRTAEEERKEREREERDHAHQRWLANDLVNMATSWRTAETLGAFLAALDGTVTQADRTEQFARWMAWAKEYAAKMDPLRDPAAVPKVLDPERRDSRSSPPKG